MKPSLLRFLKLELAAAGALAAATPAMAAQEHTSSLTTGPICEVFDSGPIPSPWTRVVSDESTVTIADHWLGCETWTKAQAHVQRPAPAWDHPTLTANVRFMGSLYLVWDADNWVAVGKVSPTPFGRFYTTLFTSGEGEPVYHRGIDAGAPQWLRIQVGDDCVRFEYSYDRKTWHFLNGTDRPAGLKGAPRFVAAGKYYPDAGRSVLAGASASPGKKPPAGVGERVNSYFRDICVEITPPDARRLTDAERQAVARMAQSDPLGREVLDRPGDPDFETVASYFPAMQRPREIAGVPEHPLAIGINHRGELDNSPWAPPIGWVEAGEPPLALRDAGPLARRLLDGWMPVITLTASRDGVDYEQTLFGWSEDWGADKDLYGYVRFRARARSGAAAPASAVLVIAGKNERRPLTPETSGTAEFCFRYRHPDLTTLEPVRAQEYEARLAETARRWRDLIRPFDRFEIPDERVADMARASYAWALLNTDTFNGQLRVHDGSGFYDMVYGYSMSLHNNALDLYGLKEQAERRYASQLAQQGPEGAYVQECGLPDQGALMWGLGQHYLLTRDREWFTRIAPQYLRGCDWIIRQRKQPADSDIARGLIKFRPYNDYPGAVYNYLGNAYCCLALEQAAEAFADVGMTTVSERLTREGAEFRKDMLESMRKSVIRRDGIDMLPLEPDTHRILKLSDHRGGDYYGLVASMLLETDFLAPDSHEARLIIDMMEQRKGLILGVCEFMEGIDHAYTYGYLLVQQRLGDIRKVLLGLWSFMAHGMTRETYSPVEVTYPPLGENHYTLPHTYSCTQQIRLVRNMLVLEQGDALNLAQAIPAAWLAPGKSVKAHEAPTLFGPVTYELSGREDGSVRVHIVPPTRNPPREIRVHLRREDGTPIGAVEKPDHVAATWSGGTLTLPNLTAPADLVVHFGKSR